ncbi:D-glycerate dehydrogenase [Candidatus Thorarchaeota archaeon]|nr:MAG: D-glycerate dehydrogenase [Candidatus Thorarchaeota archaeon]
MAKVFVTRRIPEKGLKRMKESHDVRIWKDQVPPTKDEIRNEADGCEGLVTLLSDQIDEELIDSLPQLKVIAQYAVGYDNIDVAAASKRGIMVTNTPGVLTETTADLTWALILAASRKIVESDRYVRNGKWTVAWGPKLLLGEDVHGATLGVVGLGRIGSAVAARAKGFNMNIVYHTRSENGTTKRAEKDLGVKRGSFDVLLRESDIITMHVPLTKETHHMIGEGEFRKMKRSAVFVNTSRGSVVDEEALYRSLKSNLIFAAGLDVFEEEPISTDNPLLTLPNVVLAPHTGSASTRTRTVMAEMCAENLVLALSGERPPNIINSEVL